jgi:hypothetical protein
VTSLLFTLLSKNVAAQAGEVKVVQTPDYLAPMAQDP